MPPFRGVPFRKRRTPRLGLSVQKFSHLSMRTIFFNSFHHFIQGKTGSGLRFARQGKRITFDNLPVLSIVFFSTLHKILLFICGSCPLSVAADRGLFVNLWPHKFLQLQDGTLYNLKDCDTDLPFYLWLLLEIFLKHGT